MVIKRKTRKDKGRHRGSYRRRVSKKKSSIKISRRRKTRKDKGRPRGSYRRRVSKTSNKASKGKSRKKTKVSKQKIKPRKSKVKISKNENGKRKMSFNENDLGIPFKEDKLYKSHFIYDVYGQFLNWKDYYTIQDIVFGVDEDDQENDHPPHNDWIREIQEELFKHGLYLFTWQGAEPKHQRKSFVLGVPKHKNLDKVIKNLPKALKKLGDMIIDVKSFRLYGNDASDMYKDEDEEIPYEKNEVKEFLNNTKNGY